MEISKEEKKRQRNLISEGIKRENALSIAEKMIYQNFPLEKVMGITGLSMSEISNIRKI